MFGGEPQVAADLMVCGCPLPAGAVGNSQPVNCRGTTFWLYPQGDRRITTRCCVCKTVEDLRVYATGWGGLTVAETVREDLSGPNGECLCGAVGHAPQPCAESRFRLFDVGNEIFACCVTCGGRFTAGVKAARK